METKTDILDDQSQMPKWAVEATSLRTVSWRPRVRVILLWAVFLGAAYSLHNYVFNGSLGYHVFTRGERDFRGRDMREIGAAYLRAPVIGCDFSGADLSNALLNSVTFEQCKFQATSFKDARLIRVTFKDCDLKGADFRHIPFCAFSLKNSILTGAKFNEATLKRGKFQNQDLRNADFTGADLADANLNGADLSGADLRGANLTNCSMVGTKLLRIRKDAKTIWPASGSKSGK